VVVAVNAEFADVPKTGGWVLYDADCPFCVRMVRRFGPLLASRRFALLPLQTPWVRLEHALPGISGISLHSYRYAWAERAKTVGKAV